MQALRAFAALLVVIHHGQNEAAILAGRTGTGFVPGDWLPWPAGVDVFFVVSGFIIVHAAGPLYGQPGARGRFLAHRLARLAPLYWLVSGLYLALGLAAPALLGGEGGRPGWAHSLASFLFWPAARADGAVLPLYGLGWTLNYEMAFYGLFALGLGLTRRGAVAWLAGALALGVGVGRLIPGLPVPLAFWSDPIVLEFAFGAGLALARAEGVRLGGLGRLALAAAGVAGLAAAPAEPSLRFLAWGLPAALLVAAAVFGRDRPGPSHGAGARALEHRPGYRIQDDARNSCFCIVFSDKPAATFRDDALALAERLGDASYALYLLHPFVLRGVREILLRSGLAPLLGPWPSLILMVALTLPAALLAHRLVERPLTRRVRRRLDRAVSSVPGTKSAARPET
ncbi:MAG: acyltransferase [Methylorubrum populi]